MINRPTQKHNSKRTKLQLEYDQQNIKNEEIDESEFEEKRPTRFGVQELAKRRLIPIGKHIYEGKPSFIPYPELTDTTYNVFTYVSPMGGGKCYCSKATTLTKEFGVITAKEMYELFHQGKTIHVISYKEGKEATWSKVTDAMYSGEKQLHKVITEGGSRIEASKDHIMLVWRDGVKNVRLKDVTTNDWVLFPKKLKTPESPDTEGEEHARMLGIFIADGNSNKQELRISNNKYREFLLTYFAKHQISYRENYRKNCYTYSVCGSSRRLLKKLIGIEEDYCVSWNKKVPSWIFTNKKYMRAFIQGLMECDGSFTTQKQGKDRKGRQKPGKRHRIELIMKSRQVINSVSLMLLSFGVRANYRTKMSRATNSNMEPAEYYSITIQGNDNLKKYLEQIPAYTQFQQERLKDWNIEAAHNSNMRYNLSGWMKKATEAMKELKIVGNYSDYTSGKQLPSDNHRFRELLRLLDEGGFEDLADEARVLIDNYYMVKIKSIEASSYDKAYDFEVKAANLLAGDGNGMFVHNSTNVRSMIYYTNKFDPDCITIIFDPMMMEYSQLSTLPINDESYERKKDNLLNEVLHDQETGKSVEVEVEPDRLSVFHVVPRFCLRQEKWNEEKGEYETTYDLTTLKIMKKDGGFIYAEDASKLSHQQIFNALNFRELRTNQIYHFYLRLGIKICNNRYGIRNWYIGDLIEVLKDGVKKYRDASEVEDYDDAETDKNTGLSSTELQLIETLEKYNEAGFFIRNASERKKYTANWRKFIRLGKIINICFMSYKKTEKVGEDFVVGSSDLILERLIEIAKDEYMGAKRKVEQKMPLTDWEQYLINNWKVNLWFEESEVFVPRDCSRVDIKKWPCIRRLDYLMSFGRKYGFKNFGFITQRTQKVNPIIFEESNNIFLGPLVGDQRDQIIKDFGLNKIKFEIQRNGGMTQVSVRDLVSTLSKDKHQWVYIGKASGKDGQTVGRVVPVQTYDSPCGP